MNLIFYSLCNSIDVTSSYFTVTTNHIVKLHAKAQDSLCIPRSTLNGDVRTSNIQDEYNKYKYSRLYIILVNT